MQNSLKEKESPVTQVIIQIYIKKKKQFTHEGE